MNTVVHRYFIAREGPFHEAVRSAAKRYNERDAAYEKLLDFDPAVEDVVITQGFGSRVVGVTLKPDCEPPRGVRVSQSMGKVRGAPIYVADRRTKDGRAFDALVKDASATLSARRKQLDSTQAIVLGCDGMEALDGRCYYRSTVGYVNDTAMLRVPIQTTDEDGEAPAPWQPVPVYGVEEVSEYAFQQVQDTGGVR